ncbi:MAG: FG-GAP-like repeat-containing protein [Bacteroidota bacterium]
MKKILNLTYTILLALFLVPFWGYAQEIERTEWIFENEDGDREDEVTGVVTDSQGNVYITGWFSGTINLDPDGSTAGQLTSANNNTDMYVAKYDADGDFIDASAWNPGLEDKANGIALSNDETRLYVVGQAEALIGGNQVYVASLSTNNLQIQQSITSFGPDDERGQSVSVGSNGNVYITGYFEASFFMGTTTVVSTEGAFVVMLDGNLGFIQGETADGTARVRCGDIEVDGSGNAYITGEFNNTINFPGEGSFTSNGGIDIFIAKYNATTNNFDMVTQIGGSSDDRSRSIALGNNSLYITGDFRGSTNFNPAGGGGASNLTAEDQYDFFVARYSLNGAFQNIYQVGGTGDRSFEQGNDVFFRNGKVYTTGRVTVTSKDEGDDRFFQGGGGNGESDAFLAIFGSNLGNPEFVERFGSADLDFGLSVTATADETVYVGGFANWARVSGSLDDNTIDSYLVKFAEKEAPPPAGIIISDKLIEQTLESTTLAGRDLNMADFDMDGDLDLAAAFKLGSAVRWYRNNAGTFSSGIPLQNNLEDPRTLSSADFDGTNGPDIVLADDDDDGSELRRYRNSGNGNRFAGSDEITDDFGGSSDVYAGDIDLDGSPDIVLTNFFTKNIVFFENSGGNFPSPTTTIPTDGRPRVVAVGDLNNDGLPDLVVVFRDDTDTPANEQAVLWYRNTGNGNFANPAEIASNSEVNNPRGAAIADFDGDRDLDVVAVSNDGGNVSVFLNQGDGNFGNPQIIGTAAKPFTVDVTDLDGDGDIDIIVGSENDGASSDQGTVTWFTNNGNSFSKENLVTIAKSQPNSIVSEDIDNDGDQDLVVAFGEDGEFEVAEANVLLALTNNVQSSPAPVILDRSAGQGDPGDIIQIYGGNFGSVIGTAQVSFGTNPAVVEKVFVEGTQLLVRVPNIASGLYDIVIRLPNGNTATSEDFQVGEEVVAAITQVNPLENVVEGTEVVIEGTGLSSNPTVKIGETTVAVESANAEGTSIRIIIPDIPAGEYDVKVTPEGGEEIVFGEQISVIETPVDPIITQVEPLQNVTAGTEVIIQGAGFGNNPTVAIGETAVTVNSVNEAGTTIRITIPATISVGSYPVKVTPDGGEEITFGEQISIVEVQGPTVINVTPGQGLVNSEVTITGIQLGEVDVLFDGVTVTPTEQTETKIVFLVPEIALGQYNIGIAFGETVIDSVASFNVVDIDDTTAPEIMPGTIVTTYSDGDEIVFTANVTDGESGVNSGTVILRYRKLGDQNFTELVMTDQGNGEFSATLSASELTSLFGSNVIAIEYFFSAADNAGNPAQTAPKAINRTVTELRLLRVSPIVNADDPQQSDYQMIGVPLQSRPVNDQFDELGEFNSDNTGDWTLYRYNSSSRTYQQFNNGFTSFEPGVGYMFAFRNFTGSIGLDGQTVAVTDNIFSITINPGFTLISNPYLVNINWADVVQHNVEEGNISNTAVKTELVKWKHGQNEFIRETSLESFEGAFVESGTELSTSVTLEIPAPIAARMNSRAGKDPFTRDLSSGAWFVPLTLKSNNQAYELGGVGMHPDAQVAGDRFDAFTPPRFIEYLDMSFPARGNLNIPFTKDVVPTQNSYVWDFEVAASGTSPVTLAWDNTRFGNSDYQLVLLDMESLVKTDLRTANSYQFTANQSRKFQLFYGNSQDIEDAMQPNQFMVGTPYPNPTSASLAIPVSVPETSRSAEVQLKVYNATGRQVADQAHSVSAGYHNLEWNGMDTEGKSVPPGLYIFRVQQGLERTFSGKFVVR